MHYVNGYMYRFCVIDCLDDNYNVEMKLPLTEYTRSIPNFRSFWRNKTILLWLLIFSRIHQVASQSCQEFSETLNQVPSCPRNQSAWEEAARLKNCSSFTKTCSEAEKYVYHCVINHYVNETFDVCAVRRILFGGFCAEYNIRAGRIQENHLTNCGGFTNPCPSPYRSTEAYRYPECYDLVQRESTTTQASFSVSTQFTLLSTNDTERDQGRSDDSAYVLEIGLLVFLSIILIVIVLMISLYVRRRRIQNVKNETTTKYAAASEPMTETPFVQNANHSSSF